MNTTNYLNVHAVRNYKDEQGNKRSHWTKIGAAFPNTKGGFSIKLDLIPVGPDFDIVAMPPQESDAKEDARA